MIYRPSNRRIKLHGLKISRIDKKSNLAQFGSICLRNPGPSARLELAGGVKRHRRGRAGATGSISTFYIIPSSALSTRSNGESLSSLTSRQKTPDTAVMSYHSTDSCSCWWNPRIITFQASGMTEINITEDEKQILPVSKHLLTRCIWMPREWSAPSPPPFLISAAKPNAVTLIWGICLPVWKIMAAGAGGILLRQLTHMDEKSCLPSPNSTFTSTSGAESPY